MAYTKAILGPEETYQAPQGPTREERWRDAARHYLTSRGFRLTGEYTLTPTIQVWAKSAGGEYEACVEILPTGDAYMWRNFLDTEVDGCWIACGEIYLAGVSP